MNDSHVGRFVRQYLNLGTRTLPADVVRRLASARELALDRQRQPSFGLALAGAGSRLRVHGVPVRGIAFAVCLFVLMGVLSYWHGQQHIAELEELDSAILTDDLPLGALVDKGFDTWLQRSEEQ